VLRSESVLPWNDPAHANEWHFTELISGVLTSDVTRSDVHAAIVHTMETTMMRVPKSSLSIT
jgi:hypothetical protein